MAVTYKSDVVTSGSFGDVPPSKGVVMAVKGTYTVLADGAIGDIIQMCPVPAGAKILDIKFVADGGTASMTASIGDGTETARFKALAALAAAVQWVANLAYGYAYTVADTIDLVTAVAAPTEGDVFEMTVMYIVE